MTLVNLTFDRTTDWVAPNSMENILIEAWGAGGAGSAGSGIFVDPNYNGNGGGGGAYARSYYSKNIFTPGRTYRIEVGSGLSEGFSGGHSFFTYNGVMYCYAQGGSGGHYGRSGGDDFLSIGNLQSSRGGAGVNGSIARPGGGGASGGSGFPGLDGLDSAGGTCEAILAGDGGNGVSDGPGTNGSFPGGGGGGGGNNFPGGRGANGLVILQYSVLDSTRGQRITKHEGVFPITFLNPKSFDDF